jgi:hypothetical protein
MEISSIPWMIRVATATPLTEVPRALPQSSIWQVSPSKRKTA